MIAARNALRASFLILGAAIALPSRAGPGAGGGQIVLRDYLVALPAGRGGRVALPADPIAAALADGSWKAPREGDPLPAGAPEGLRWQAARADEEGVLAHPGYRGGSAFARVAGEGERVMILQASGHSSVLVNGEPRAGDPYSTGYVLLPVLLRAGENEFLFRGGRGRLQARLTPPAGELILDTADATLPDLVRGQDGDLLAAVVLVNATREPQAGLSLRAAGEGVPERTTRLPEIAPLTVRKIGFTLAGRAPKAGDHRKYRLRLLGRSGAAPEAEVTLRVREPHQTRKVTFRSGIDGSVQYYAVNPASTEVGNPALFLTLHGAGVEAIGQADAYSPKPWGHLVAPTNRRPFGFDWEDWGRLDALEVLEHARKALRADPSRTYLTGHSMGGHGTWHLGVTYPDRWAAIGPSAGWISFFTYAGGRRPENPDAMRSLLQRAAGPSDTQALAGNLTGPGVYILHGDADDNVPVAQARRMREILAAHPDLCYHEQPGAGHWWDSSPEPGADCVDWAPMFEFFARRRLPAPAEVRRIEFATMNPGVSARRHWVTIEDQVRRLELSRVTAECDPGRRHFRLATQNVSRLAVDLAPVTGPGLIALEIDGARLELPAGTPTLVRLERRDGGWVLSGARPPGGKVPRRFGPFKAAFDHRFVLVYGTGGTEEERRWAYARARYDAETFWYRGNGSPDLVPDTAFHAERDRDRSVILYGNADTNRAWSGLLGSSEVQVRRGEIVLGAARRPGGDVGCLLVQPRPGSDVALVAAVGGTGTAGMRVTDALPYFVSGVDYPDLLALSPAALRGDATGIRAAAIFGSDWKLAGGELLENRRP